MQVTKEQVVALAALVVSLVVLVDLRTRLPSAEPIPPEPAVEEARPYRAAGGAPPLAPERIFAAARDPFQVQDPWAEARPGLLDLPPAVTWPRALPGGAVLRPDEASDRLLIPALPREVSR